MVASWEHIISTIKQVKLMHFHKTAFELELTALVLVPSTVPVVPAGPALTPASVVSSSKHAPSVLYIVAVDITSSPSVHLSFKLSLQEQEEVCAVHAPVREKGKDKVKATEEDDDDEDKATKKRHQEWRIL
ncbi:hypothetical protein C0995_015224 [Termitomyces sp. Mi166|nr:hypothetical protein C0995_015224 [Termitomyces sp. Mi166\